MHLPRLMIRPNRYKIRNGSTHKVYLVIGLSAKIRSDADYFSSVYQATQKKTYITILCPASLAEAGLSCVRKTIPCVLASSIWAVVEARLGSIVITRMITLTRGLSVKFRVEHSATV